MSSHVDVQYYICGTLFFLGQKRVSPCSKSNLNILKINVCKSSSKNKDYHPEHLFIVSHFEKEKRYER